jgi:hypothetical protein
VRHSVEEEPAPLPAVFEPAAEAVDEPVEENDAEYCPRRTAPELTTNMSAMRELANTAARSAIDRHVRQHTGKQAAGKLVGACLTVLASGVVGYWAARAHSLPAGVAAAIGGCVGVHWTWAAFRRLTTLRRLNQLSAAEAKANQPAGDVPPPAA